MLLGGLLGVLSGWLLGGFARVFWVVDRVLLVGLTRLFWVVG